MKLLILIFLFSVFTVQQLSAQNNNSNTLTNELIWKQYAFYARSVEGFRSMNDGLHFTRIDRGQSGNGILMSSFEKYNQAPKLIVHPDDLRYKEKQLVVDEYLFNADETKLLIATDYTSIYRRSYLANFYIFDLHTRKLEPLHTDFAPQTLAEFSPDGKKVAFIYGNNIYIKDLETGKTKAVTTDGKTNSIINGTTDWVYEEEFSITKGFYWSPDSKRIAFLKFTETNVKEFTMTYYSDLYPDLYTFKYPKAGEDNSKVSLHLYELANEKTDLVELGNYEYIPRISYSPIGNQLIALTLNRHQNQLRYHLINSESAPYTAQLIYEETDDAYVEIDDNLLFMQDGKSFIRTSEMHGYNHIYKISFTGEKEQITKGNWDVIEFKGVNFEKNLIYYTSAENGATQQDLFSINYKTKKKNQLSTKKGHTDAEFSTGMKYYIQTWSDANTPPITSLHNAAGKQLFILENNTNLVKRLENFNLSKKEFFTIKGHDQELNASMIKPADFDPQKKYPIYIHIYCGPGNNTVEDAWGGMDYMYHQLLAQKGYIVLSVDPRGTMYRGAKFKKSTYLQLGKLELEDLVAVAKELKTRSYVDADRIGIQGWSYGGYMTSLAMTKGAPHFKMGIAVAPVTNWRFYDNIYTERFMQTPQENPDGYDDNSPINYTHLLEGKYFLIHGSGDDNVHLQNAMEMVNSLVAANKQFDLFIYPNRNHGIYGGNTRLHLFNMLLDYTLKNL
jgi:dipeptidyl-peptidase 4